MALSPASSLGPATVVVAGTVAVSNLPADQGVHFTSPQSVTGPLTDTQLAARLPLSVTGPLTDAQLAARLPLSVSVGNFPADQLVHFAAVQHVIVDSGAVTVSGTATVSGTVAVTQSTSPWVVDGSGVTQPVSGPLTNAQLRAGAVAVDGSAVTQPVSAASLPLPAGAATEKSMMEARRSLNDVALTAILEREKVDE